MKIKNMMLCAIVLFLGFLAGRVEIKEAQASSGNYQIVSPDMMVVYLLDSSSGDVYVIKWLTDSKKYVSEKIFSFKESNADSFYRQP